MISFCTKFIIHCFVLHANRIGWPVPGIQYTRRGRSTPDPTVLKRYGQVGTVKCAVETKLVAVAGVQRSTREIGRVVGKRLVRINAGEVIAANGQLQPLRNIAGHDQVEGGFGPKRLAAVVAAGGFLSGRDRAEIVGPHGGVEPIVAVAHRGQNFLAGLAGLDQRPADGINHDHLFGRTRRQQVWCGPGVSDPGFIQRKGQTGAETIAGSAVGRYKINASGAGVDVVGEKIDLLRRRKQRFQGRYVVDHQILRQNNPVGDADLIGIKSHQQVGAYFGRQTQTVVPGGFRLERINTQLQQARFGASQQARLPGLARLNRGDG